MGLNYLTDLFEHVNRFESISGISDWFQNAIANSTVKVIYDNSTFVGSAKIVNDDALNQKISHLKYPGEKRAEEKRVAIEITLHEQL